METFVPLYISNKCDSYCLMCGFNHSNSNLIRKTATFEEITNQLEIIRDYEKISAVCILTGELFLRTDRFENLSHVCAAINEALRLGFERVFFNIGSLDETEIEFIKAKISSPEKLVLSLFQETYDQDAYKQYFGLHPECNAKANYQNRIDTIERWINAGFKCVDIGVLLGFKPIGNDINDLITYAQKYLSYGAEVYISTPRVKNGVVNDEEYKKILNELHTSLPTAKLIVTTREKINFINSILDIILVVSPGSSDICPYSRGTYLSNNIETSQFVIEEKRMRPFDVLSSIKCPEKIRFFNK